MFSKKRQRATVEQELDPSNFTSTQAAIGFSVLGLVAALVFTVVVGSDFDSDEGVFAFDFGNSAGIDTRVVGSISKGNGSKGNVKTYTEHYSVLKSNVEQPCVIFADGSQKGNC